MASSETIRGYIELLRPHNLFVSAITTLVGYSVVSKLQDGSIVGFDYLIASTIVVLIAAAGYVINDYYDIETDKISKPWRPIVRGSVKPEHARYFAYLLFILGITVALLSSLLIGLFALISGLLVHEYSRWIKKTGFIGNIAVSIESAATILFGGFFAAVYHGAYVPLIVLIPTIYAFLFVLGREIVKGIEDVEGDKQANIYTLAVTVGPHRAAIIATIILAIVVLISPLPWMAGIYNVLYLIFAAGVDLSIIVSILLLGRGKTLNELIEASRKARSLLKIGFLMGGLAFLLGII
ncbi:UbiA family prenyltransferase [Pyrofollis japonicus]|uniref:geranylgeranylglycerol-phosphate geranylgeranyltransferase n=1 Tax=Pyrofollis japonicus TaxID=3060460 RepID=UPI00295AF160|nr:geranylgeranylglycerol-phosphate geranylgeranyltransferase [Pyrofollis japonicus]BEP18168.1 UbiA family prenyltransferase [Pyrofollis japonicus]